MITAKLLLYNYGKPTRKGYPLKVLVTAERRTKPVHLKRYCQAQYWNKEKEEPRRSCPDKNLGLWVQRKKAEVARMVDEANDHNLSLEETVELLKFPSQEKPAQMGLLEFYQKRIEEIGDLGGSVSVYEQVLRQLQRYTLGKDVGLDKVDWNWVREFKEYKLKDGMSANGLHVYLRNFRTVYYEARRRGLVDRSLPNPFEGNMPRLKRTKKRALEVEDIDKLETGPIHDRTRLWLLQFYLGGMDFYDIASLRWEQIQGHQLSYQRGKLAGRGEVIELRIFEKAWTIINDLASRDTHRLFPFIPDPDDDAQRYASFRNNLNKRYLRKDSETLELSKPITTKSARHTFRTVGRRKLVDGDIIMELMGHQGEGVEYIYQDRFTREQRDQAQAEIIGALDELKGK